MDRRKDDIVARNQIRNGWFLTPRPMPSAYLLTAPSCYHGQTTYTQYEKANCDNSPAGTGEGGSNRQIAGTVSAARACGASMERQRPGVTLQ